MLSFLFNGYGTKDKLCTILSSYGRHVTGDTQIGLLVSAALDRIIGEYNHIIIHNGALYKGRIYFKYDKSTINIGGRFTLNNICFYEEGKTAIAL
jgi:hypothetical protein